MAKKYVVAAQLYTLRDFLKTPEDIAKTMARLKKIGYDAAEIAGLGPLSAADYAAVMKKAGVTPIGMHANLIEFRASPAQVVANCKALNVKYATIPWLPCQEYTTAAEWKKLFKEIEGYAKILAKDGVTLQYHNHMFEFQKFGIKKGTGGTTILETIYSGTKLLKSELDCGWVARGGHDPVAWVKCLKGRLDQVHLKDWGILNNEPIWRAIGEGGIDWAAVIKACKASGTKYFIVEQDTCPVTNDPFLSLAVSRKNLLKLGL